MKEEENYVFKESEVQTYASACIDIAEALKKLKPDAFLCPLRGGLPPATIVFKLFEQAKMRNNFATVPTSNFVEDRNVLLGVALNDLVGNAIDNVDFPLEGRVKIATIDTAISGTSTQHFMDMLKIHLPLLEMRYNVSIDYFLIKLWQKPDQIRAKNKSLRFHSNTQKAKINQAVVYVPNLLCEDVDGLLGYKYGFTNRRGVKTAELIEVKDRRVIAIDRDNDYPLVYLGRNASDVFVDIIVRYANRIKEECESEKSERILIRA